MGCVLRGLPQAHRNVWQNKNPHPTWGEGIIFPRGSTQIYRHPTGVDLLAAVNGANRSPILAGSRRSKARSRGVFGGWRWRRLSANGLLSLAAPEAAYSSRSGLFRYKEHFNTQDEASQGKMKHNRVIQVTI